MCIMCIMCLQTHSFDTEEINDFITSLKQCFKIKEPQSKAIAEESHVTYMQIYFESNIASKGTKLSTFINKSQQSSFMNDL